MKTSLSTVLAARVALEALVALAVGASSVAAHAGSIQLIVTDKEGKPVPDVVVMVDPATPVIPALTAPPAPPALPATTPPAAAPVVITQEGQRFVPFLTVVQVGSTLRFVNRDSYDHHVRSTPSGPLGSTPAVKNFELRLDSVEGAPSPDDGYKSPAPARKRSGTSSAEVKVDAAGAIGLACHIHASMRGQVYVSGTPWFAKTDANGAAVIDGVPDGAAELNLWHPDQLQEQAVQRVQVGAAPLRAGAQLNFTPRRRRS